jgi:hypothetical protein
MEKIVRSYTSPHVKGEKVNVSLLESQTALFNFNDFAFDPIFIAVRGMLNPSDFLFPLMMFSLGLLFAVQAIEMYVSKRRKYFVLTVLNSLWTISVGVVILLSTLNIF